MTRKSLRLALLTLAATAALLAACAPIRHNVRYFDLLAQPLPDWLPVPVQGVPLARVRDSWGEARSGGRRHEGIDIFAPRGTPVLSATEGVIASKGERGLGGRIVYVTGPGGYRHYYAHLEDWGEQAVGDWVSPGDVIGYVGNSGNAAGGPTHLHYGIYGPMGQAINPFPLLQAGKGRTAPAAPAVTGTSPASPRSRPAPGRPRSRRGTGSPPWRRRG